MKERYDSSANGTLLERRDPVWLHNPQRKKGKSPKLTRPWQGPYLVIKRINDVVYRIQLNPKSKPKVVHRNRLWRYSGASPPDWLDRANLSRLDESSVPLAKSPARLPATLDMSLTTSATVALPRLSSEGSTLRRSSRSRRSPDRLHYSKF